MRVRTTIDLKMQDMAREAIAKELPPSIGPTAALVALDAHTGAVLAMIGGRNYHKSQFNLATQGERQPGSSFKPFVLAAALKAGISPTTTFDSKPITIDADGRVWNVNNYESDYNGTINLSQAIAYSDNSVFAQLTNVVGPGNVATTAKALGVGTPLNGYFSIGLGGEAATPLDMARAYAAFANGGYRMDGAMFGDEPRVVSCLEDAEGNCKKDNGIRAKPVLQSWQADTVNQMLQGVVTFGTGKAARLPGYQVAGKTGTTENYGDAWFVGYTPDLVTAVWVGYPDELRADADRVPRQAGGGRDVSGSDLEGVHGERPAVPRREPRGELVHLAAVRVGVDPERRAPRPQARARQRPLHERDDGAGLHRGAARHRRLRLETRTAGSGSATQDRRSATEARRLSSARCAGPSRPPADARPARSSKGGASSGRPSCSRVTPSA